MQQRKEAYVRDIFPRLFTPRRSIQIIAGCILFLSVIAFGVVLQQARPVMVPMASAFVLSIILAPVLTRLIRIGLPEAAAAALITVATLALFFSVLFFAGKPALAWANELPQFSQAVREKLKSFEHAVTTVKQVTEQVSEITSLDESKGSKEVVVQDKSDDAFLFAALPMMFVQILFTWVLLFFLLSSRTDLRRKFVLMNRTMSGRIRALKISRQIESKIGSYMLAMATISTFMGLAMGLIAYFLGMPSPHVWGFLAALLNFIPYVGPFAMTVLLGLSGLVHFDDPLHAAAPMISFILLNFIESNVVTPFVVGMKMRVTPIAIIVSVSLVTWLWGPVGGLLAIPLLVIFKTLCDLTPFLRPVGVLIGELKPIERRTRGDGRRRLAPASTQ